MPRPKLSTVSLASLQAEIERRKGKLARMVVERDALNQQIAELGALAGPQQPAPLAPTSAPKPGKKPGPKPGKKAPAQRATGRTLAQYVHEVLAAAARGLSLKEIEAKVLAAGYPTKAASIYKQVMKVLSKGFKRVKRGVYAVEAAVVKAGKKAAQAAMAPVAQKPKRRGQFPETAEQFILGLVKGKGATTAQINQKWSESGRPGSASPNLSVLFKARKTKREPLGGKKGFLYSVA